jgi:patatin-like phospholipase/acyl hydrolase
MPANEIDFLDRDSKQRFRVLSLDGGGLKGVFEAAFLAAVEEDLGVSILDHFDLITGTSTGSIIAVGLGLGLRAAEILEFYKAKAKSIFPYKESTEWLRRLGQYTATKHDPAGLQAELIGVFGEKKLGDSLKPLVIPSYNLDADDVYVFKTPHSTRFKRDWRVPAWQVCMASCAAPTYLPTFTGVGGLRLVDGGVWANNPMMVGVVEAMSEFKQDPANISVLSISTTTAIKDRPDRLDRGGNMAWAAESVDVAFAGQSACALGQAQLLCGRDYVFRVDVPVPADAYTLDGPIKQSLISRALVQSRKDMPAIEAKFFFGPTDRQYIPLNQPAQKGLAS